MTSYIEQFKKQSRLLLFLVVGLTLIASALLPAIMPRGAAAAQITKRALTISSGVTSATNVTYTFGASTGGADTTSGFFFGTSHIVKGMKFEACTTAVGSCTHPTGIDLKTSVGGFTLTGWQDATAFTQTTTNTNDCDGTQTYDLCISRAGASSSEDTTHSHKIVVTGVVNQDNTNCSSNPNCTFFIRMSTYTTSTYTASATDTGTVASSTVQSLTVNAAVAEVLSFCSGSTTVNDISTNVASDCSGVSGTSLNIGTLDTSTVNTSPINTNGGDNKNGVLMLRTNAVNGATVSYDAIQQAGGSNHLGTLRISGAACNAGNVQTDQCIDAQGGSQGTFTAGTEKFGMTVGGVNGGSTSSYTCNYAAGPSNCALKPTSGYYGAGSLGSESYGTSNGFAWVEGGTVTQIASSSSVVDDEALILRFAATPSITTPFGAYTAQSDFIAVPTY